MDLYTQPEKKPGRGQLGCTVLFVGIAILIGLLMWFFLWGRAAPPSDDPAVPVRATAQL